MKVYEPKNIRNLAFIGHAGTGKTIFSEALLYKSGAINRRGSVEDKNTTSDYHELEQEKGSSVFSSVMFAEYKDTKINFIDCPGYDDYIGEMIAPLEAVDCGVIFLNAQNGIEVGAEHGWTYTSKMNKPAVIVVNKLDVDQANWDKVLEDVKSQFGNSVKILQYPVKIGNSFNQIIDILSMKMYTFDADGNAKEEDIPAGEKSKADELRNELIESIAETDEELMNKYFEAGELSEDEIKTGLKNAIKARSIFPLLCTSGKNLAGITRFLDFVVDYLPSPLELPVYTESGSTEVTTDVAKPASLFIFKMFSDAKTGDMTFFRVHTGKVRSGLDMINSNRGQSERIGQVYTVCGKKRTEVAEIPAGDIGATVKLKTTNINDTLAEKNFNVIYRKVEYPNPKVRTGVVPKTKGEEEKVGMGLNNLHAEDPTVVIEHSQELRQTIVYAQGELHLGVIKWRLANRYKVEADFVEPRVPYRETIQKPARGMYRHKKQSGGAGQFAEVHMLIEPWVENMPDPAGLTVRGKELIQLDWGGVLEYVNCIVGGVIDARFMPAILKGIMEKMQEGPLTGSYVRDIRVSIYDGKMHPVDSNEAAFKTAGMMAFKETFVQAAPKILEPIYELDIKVPEEFMGDVMSDLPSRRGLILGIDSEGKYQKIKARMPLAELDKYATALRSMTQARATYSAKFVEYQTVPPNVQQELIEAYKKSQQEEA